MTLRTHKGLDKGWINNAGVRHNLKTNHNINFDFKESKILVYKHYKNCRKFVKSNF